MITTRDITTTTSMAQLDAMLSQAATERGCDLMPGATLRSRAAHYQRKASRLKPGTEKAEQTQAFADLLTKAATHNKTLLHRLIESAAS